MTVNTLLTDRYLKNASDLLNTCPFSSHTERTCWQHNQFSCNISRRQDVVDKSVGGRILKICCRFAADTAIQQVSSKSRANHLMRFELMYSCEQLRLHHYYVAGQAARTDFFFISVPGNRIPNKAAETKVTHKIRFIQTNTSRSTSSISSNTSKRIKQLTSILLNRPILNLSMRTLFSFPK
jgi:hypothetical protein